MRTHALLAALSLTLAAAACDKNRPDTTTPLPPGAEKGGAGSDGTNSVTDATGTSPSDPTTPSDTMTNPDTPTAPPSR
jgi:nitrous oxide reductase accessory protein NosL